MNLMVKSLQTAKQALEDQREAICSHTGKKKDTWMEGYMQAQKIVDEISKELAGILAEKHVERQLNESKEFLENPEAYEDFRTVTQ